MRKQIAVLLVMMLMAAVLPHTWALSTVTIQKPASDIAVPVGYDLVLEAQAPGADRVEFWEAGRVVGTAAQSDGIYQFVWQNLPKGDHVITARGYDAAGGYVDSEPVTVRTTDYQAVETFAEEHFDDLDISLASRGNKAYTNVVTDFALYGEFHDTISTQPSPQGTGQPAKTGKSLLIEKGAGDYGAGKLASVTYQGPGIETATRNQIGKGQRLRFAVSVYAEQTDVAFSPLEIINGTSGNTLAFLKFERTGQIVYSYYTDVDGTEKEQKLAVGTYEANKWYQLRYEFDTQNMLVDCWLDGERIVAQQPFRLPSNFQSGNLYGIRTRMESRQGYDSRIYVDDLTWEHDVPPASTEVIWVDQTGADGAYTTIQAGIDAAQTSGATVLVRDGIYEEDVLFTKAGSKYDKFTLQAVGDGAVIRGSVTMAESAPYIRVEGFELDGQAKIPYTEEQLAYIAASFAEGGTPLTQAEKEAFWAQEDAATRSAFTVKSRGCEVVGNEIHHFMGYGVSLAYDKGVDAYVAGNRMDNCSGGVYVASGAVVEYNEIANINIFGGANVAGDIFRIFGSDIIIRGNYSHGTTREGVKKVLPTSAGDWLAHADVIQSWDTYAAYIQNVLIEDNVFLGFYHQGVMLENDNFGAGGGPLYIRDWTLRNNIFSGFEAWAICGGKTDGGVPGMVVENNVFRAHQDGSHNGVVFRGRGASGIARNNVFIGKGLAVMESATVQADYNVYLNGAVAGSGCAGAHDQVLAAVADACFVRFNAADANDDNPATMSDYHLLAQSPLIDAGTDVSFPTDQDGLPRKIGSHVDIGPYEYDSRPQVAAEIVQEGTSLMGSVTIQNRGDTAISAICALASYRDGELLDIDYQPVTVPAGEHHYALSLADVPADMTEAKLFVWDAGMVPLLPEPAVFAGGANEMRKGEAE